MKRLSVLLLVIAILASCKRDFFSVDPANRIETSADTLFFDTVFTQTGSVTKSFKIINSNRQKLRLSSIELAGGSQSPFKLNIDGTASVSVADAVIDANDSMYVFVQVLIDPDAQQQPFIVEDSIRIRYNGNEDYVQLRAYGQNAVFLKDEVISADTIWNDHLPVVILGSLIVDTGATLTIDAGNRIFVHATAPVIIHGTLRATGTAEKPVTFAGDRTDSDYRDLPASWPGIYFTGSSAGNLIQHAIIKNAYQGLIVQEMPADLSPKLRISRTVVQNIYDAAIIGINSSIVADNLLIANCGSNIALVLGGSYDFINCTVATYGSFYIVHKNPVVQVSDYLEQGGIMFTGDLRASFVNSIFWGDQGSVDNEILAVKKGTGQFEVTFDHCIYKAKETVSNVQFIDSYANEDPLFDSINVSKNIYDFRLSPASPAVKAGRAVPYHYDVNGNPRVDPPDIGCYERQ